MGAPDPRDGSRAAGKRHIDVDAGKQFWSFQPARPAQPCRGQERRAGCATPIDRFILAKLEEKGLAPEPALSQGRS